LKTMSALSARYTAFAAVSARNTGLADNLDFDAVFGTASNRAAKYIRTYVLQPAPRLGAARESLRRCCYGPAVHAL
jgi:hypothetical protein